MGAVEAETVAEVHHLTEGDLDYLTEQALDEADVTLEELRAQAKLGRFSSERARQAWFVLNSLGRA